MIIIHLLENSRDYYYYVLLYHMFCVSEVEIFRNSFFNN